MLINEKPKFAALMMGVGELYGKAMSKALIQIYWDALKHLDFVDIQNAFQKHISQPETGEFIPKPASIICAIEGNLQTRALKAWTKVDWAIKHVGSYSSVAFDDPFIHVVITEMGGWIKLCSLKQKDLTFVAKEFEVRYRGSLCNKPISHPKYLLGTVERENNHTGFSFSPPRLIGDPSKAIAVIEAGKATTYLIQDLSPEKYSDIKDILRLVSDQPIDLIKFLEGNNAN